MPREQRQALFCGKLQQNYCCALHSCISCASTMLILLSNPTRNSPSQVQNPWVPMPMSPIHYAHSPFDPNPRRFHVMQACNSPVYPIAMPRSMLCLCLTPSPYSPNLQKCLVSTPSLQIPQQCSNAMHSQCPCSKP